MSSGRVAVTVSGHGALFAGAISPQEVDIRSEGRIARRNAGIAATRANWRGGMLIALE